MANAFSRQAVLVLKIGFIASIVLVVTVVLVWRRTIYPATPGAPMQQPLPFSHAHHVGDDGIECRYCHTSVESSGFAGIPSTHTCLTCHSQLFKDSALFAPLFDSVRTQTPIKWQRVHKLPEFVYFDHSIHLRKGVGCVECHGRVDRMPLT